MRSRQNPRDSKIQKIQRGLKQAFPQLATELTLNDLKDCKASLVKKVYRYFLATVIIPPNSIVNSIGCSIGKKSDEKRLINEAAFLKATVSIRECCLIKAMVRAVGVKDFSLLDLIRPDVKRTHFIFSRLLSLERLSKVIDNRFTQLRLERSAEVAKYNEFERKLNKVTSSIGNYEQMIDLLKAIPERMKLKDTSQIQADILNLKSKLSAMQENKISLEEQLSEIEKKVEQTNGQCESLRQLVRNDPAKLAEEVTVCEQKAVQSDGFLDAKQQYLWQLKALRMERDVTLERMAKFIEQAEHIRLDLQTVAKLVSKRESGLGKETMWENALAGVKDRVSKLQQTKASLDTLMSEITCEEFPKGKLDEKERLVSELRNSLNILDDNVKKERTCLASLHDAESHLSNLLETECNTHNAMVAKFNELMKTNEEQFILAEEKLYKCLNMLNKAQAF